MSHGLATGFERASVEVTSVEVRRRRVVVHGRVHGVGFRAACARRATQAELGGWVRNLPDGTVEAVFEGDPNSVDALTAWCNKGPTMAHVEKIERFDELPSGEVGFSVR